MTDDEIVVKQSTFSLGVKKWAHEEQLNDFVNQWFSLLTVIYTTTYRELLVAISDRSTDESKKRS